MVSCDFTHIARQHGVRLLLQFCSTVTGRAHAASDVDLAALFDGEPTLARVGDLHADLASAFPGREVDLGVLNHADPLFLERALAHARLLAGAARDLAELRLFSFRQYQDHRRYLDLERTFVDKFLAARIHP